MDHSKEVKRKVRPNEGFSKTLQPTIVQEAESGRGEVVSVETTIIGAFMATEVQQGKHKDNKSLKDHFQDDQPPL